MTASIKNINFLTVQESLKKFNAVLLFVLRGGDALQFGEIVEREIDLLKIFFNLHC